MFKPLYKLTSTGAIQQWQIFVSVDGYFWTRYGQVDGAIVETNPTKCKRKNVGKINETTEEEQAILEAQSKYEKKLKEGYKEDINNVAEFTYYKPMLAKKWEDYEDKISFPVYSNPKYDGKRCIANKDGLFTRAGNRIHSCPFIFSALEPLFKLFPNMIIDGELYSHEHKDNFNEICSLTAKQDPSKEEIEECKKYIKYYVYDFPVINSKLTENHDFIDRFIIGQNLINGVNHVVLVKPIEVLNHSELDTLFNTLLEEGYEGQIVRVNGPYENKRSKYLLKRKIFQDDEYEVICFNEGVGDRAGTAASVTCITKNGDIFNAGIIGDVEYAAKLLEDNDLHTGSMATITFFNLTPSGIPRFGKFKSIRNIIE